MNKNNSKIINISKRTFLTVVIILAALILVSSILTYVIPRGRFVTVDGEIDYSNFVLEAGTGGIGIIRAVFSPLLVLTSSDGVSLAMLCLFLVCVSVTFQIMNDTRGTEAIVLKLISRFKAKKGLLISLITLIFMCFGAFFGLFEETLALLPLVVALCLSLGYDKYTAFLICTVATAFGFSCAITNPFTVLYASNIIGASLISGVWFRFAVLIVVYGILLGFVYLHIRKLNKERALAESGAGKNTADGDRVCFNNAMLYEDSYECPKQAALSSQQTNKLTKVYAALLSVIFLSIIIATSIPATRGYTVVILIGVFIIGAIVCGLLTCESKRQLAKSAYVGAMAALPAVLMVLMASAIKYILAEGEILDTIVHYLDKLVTGNNSYVTVLCVFAVIIVLEFFISSSTAKAVFVMNIMKILVATGAVAVSSELVVLTYIFSDGFTNALFPTSPVLLIALSICGLSYTKWVRRSFPIFLCIFVVVLGALMLAVAMGY